MLTQLYDGHLNRCGLKTSQFSVLRAIHYLRKTTNSELQEVLVLDQTSLSRAIKPLLRDGFVHVQLGVDKRQKVLFLSPSGLALYQEAKALWKVAQNEAKERLGAEVREKLLEVCEAVVALRK